MATRPEALPAPATTDEERAYIASQWKLVWWRFRRHRMALVGAAFVIAFYIIAILPEFLAIHDPGLVLPRGPTFRLNAFTSSMAGGPTGPTSTVSSSTVTP